MSSFFSVIFQTIIGFALLASGALICLNHFKWNDTITILICLTRFVAGSCFGFVYITTLAHIADNVPKHKRGFVSTKLAMTSSIVGFAVSITHEGSSGYVPPSIRDLIVVYTTDYTWIMILTIILTFCLTLSMTLTETNEPFTWYLKSGKIDEIQSALKLKWSGQMQPNDIQYEFDERVKMMSDYHQSDTCFFSIFTNGNLKPILLMLSLRMINVLVFFVQGLCFDQYHYSYHLAYVLACSAIGYRLDIWQKKYFLLFGVLPGLLIATYLKRFLAGELAAGYFVVVFFGFEPLIHVYSAEAFPWNKRNASLAFVTCLECIFSGFFWYGIRKFKDHLPDQLIWWNAGIICVVSMCLVLVVPETKQQSIRQCPANFNKSLRDRNVPSDQVMP